MKNNPLKHPGAVVTDFLFVERVKKLCGEMPVVYAVGPVLEGWVRVVFPSLGVTFWEKDRPGLWVNVVHLRNGDYFDLKTVE